MYMTYNLNGKSVSPTETQKRRSYESESVEG